MHEHIKAAVIDGGVVAAGWTAPWWLGGAEGWLQLALLAGGVLLLALRILVAWREWRGKKVGLLAKGVDDAADGPG